ncbi:Eaa1 [Klebsiella pneumoniae]|nr:Eaa1 [Klebsiella pneumoniae]
MSYCKLTREERVQALYDLKVGQVLSLADIENVKMLSRIALDAMDRDQVRNEHAEWSQATFGNVGPVGPLKHLSKEALEAAAAPDDLSEWADMQFLMWDAQRRAGITDAQITQAMIEKVAVNKQREWPEPKDGEPRLHIKSQPATQEVHDEK